MLTDLLHEGKVRAIGSSTFPAEEIVEAQWVAEHARLRTVPVRTAAVLDPGARDRARGAARPALRYGMGVIVWSPLNGGWLTGKYKRGQDVPEGDTRDRGA